ncbi:MAG: MBL fold metallo-hydrolase [Clostridia bacterium]|nr:MBL fold metallo-hydrolase [Clostridia bacterium]
MLKIHTLFPRGYFGANCYLVNSQDEWAVIDPSVSMEEAVKAYPEAEGKIKYILITHAHFDHICNIDSWCKDGAIVIVGELDAPALSDPQTNCYLGFLGVRGGYFGEYTTVREGDTLTLGDENFSVVFTPGHTKGGVCYKFRQGIFVGDTLFADGGYGRCDLPGGNEDDLWSSIFKLFSENMIGRFYPGHGNCDTFENSINYFK